MTHPKNKVISLIVFYIMLFSCDFVVAQDNLKKYLSGYYINNNNDTISGYLKNFSKSKSCTKIRFKKDSVSKAYDVLPENTKSYVRESEYFISKNVGSEDFTIISFVKPIINGELTLYRRWVMRTSSNQYSTYSTEVQLNYIELKGKPILKVKKTNYRKKIASYLSENKELAYRILNKDITDLEQIVNEYNKWDKGGRNNDTPIALKNEFNEKLELLTDSKWALEFPFSFTKSFILVEAQLAKFVEVKDGIRPDFGLGMRYSINDEFKFRFGFRYWSIPINPSYELKVGPSEDSFYKFDIIEKSSLNNISMYLHLHYEGTNTFIGGGFNFGVNNFYKTNLSYYNEDGDFIFSERDNKTFLSSDFLNQSHFEIIAGLKFNTKSKMAFKPFVKVSLPFQSIYDSNSPRNTAYDMYATQISFGLITELGLTK